MCVKTCFIGHVVHIGKTAIEKYSGSFKRLLNIPIDVRNSSGKYTENLSSQTLWRCIDKTLRLNIQFFIYRTPPIGMLFAHVWKHKRIGKIKNWKIRCFSNSETFDNSERIMIKLTSNNLFLLALISYIRFFYVLE